MAALVSYFLKCVFSAIRVLSENLEDVLNEIKSLRRELRKDKKESSLLDKIREEDGVGES
jgi:hypothetical protein